MNIKVPLSLLAVSLLCQLPASAQLPFNESFESDGNGPRYVLSSQFNDLLNNNIFDWTTNTSHADQGGAYSGFSGNGIFAAEDTDDALGSGADEQTITFTINITGGTGLMFDGLFAGGTAAVDTDDHVHVVAQVDGGPEQRLLSFESQGNLNSTPWQQDTNHDGLGDGTNLTNAFQKFTAPISGSGTNLTLTIRIEADSGFESFAMDDLNITGAAGPSTVSSINRVTPSPSNAASVQWDVTFANPVGGLSASNLNLVDVGASLTGESLTSVTDLGSMTTWRVTANTGTGNGTLRLDLANDTGLSPGITNAPFTGGQTIVIDKSGPGITISAPSSPLTASGPVSYTLTYSGASSVTLNNGQIMLNTTGGASASSVNVSGTGNTTRVVTIGGTTGDGTIGISISGGSATDGANLSSAAGPSATFEVDNTPPGVTIGAPSVASTAGGPIEFPITFSGADSISLNPGNIILNLTGSANATTINVTGSGTTSRTVILSGVTGDGLLGISVAASTAADAAGNTAAPAGPSDTVIVDNPNTAGTALLCEEFDTDGNGSRYTLSSQFFSAGGIFDRTNDLSVAEDGSYSGQSGSGIFVAEDTADAAGNGAPEQTITFNVDIAGKTDLEFYGLFAAGDEAPASYDNDDHIIVEAQIDGGAIQRLLQFESLANLNSVPMHPDLNFDGQGDVGSTPLGLQFQPFSAPIVGTGASLTLTIKIEADSSFESLALDLIKVTSAGDGPPEIDVHDGALITDPSIANGGAAADFGTTSESAGQVDRIFNIDNTLGGTPLNISSIEIVGTDAADFSLIGVAPSLVASGASTTITLRFDPSAEATRSATLQINSDDSDEAVYDISLTGTGDATAPEIDLHDGPLTSNPPIASGGLANSFGSVFAAGGTADKIFNIDNTAGDFALSISAITFSGGSAGDFSLVGSPPATIPAGSSDTITVRFNPSAIGARIATMQVSSNDSDEASYSVGLSGSGIEGNLINCEDFEDDGNTTRYNLSSQFFGPGGIFDQTTDLSVAEDGSYSGQSGSGIFVAEDTSDSAGSGAPEQTITFNVDITSQVGLVFSGLFGAGDEAPASYDPDDHIIVEAQIDGGAVQTLLQFESTSGSVGSQPLAEDTNLDGVGDGMVLGLGLQEFSAPITGTGTDLTLTIRISMNSSFESVALDFLKVIGSVPEPPVVSALARNIIEDQSVTFAQPDFDAGFNDPNPGNTLQVLRITSLPTTGALFDNGTPITTIPTDIARADIGTLSYVPLANFGGPTATFGWNASDGANFASSDTTYTFNITEQNDSPVADDDSFARFAGSSLKIPVANILLGDGDPSDSPPDLPLSINSLTASASGAIVTTDGTTVFYNPNGHNGADTFTYTIVDARGAVSETATVTITIENDEAQSQNIVKVSPQPDGSTNLAFAGIPGRTYRIQGSSDLTPGSWVTLTTIAADAQGKIEYTDPAPNPPTFFYRAVTP